MLDTTRIGTGFVDRYGAAFGRSNGLLLRMSGLLNGEQEAEGAWITDSVGRSWLDLGSFGVHLLGHRHPHVVAAASSQLQRMGLSGKILGNASATALAEALLAATPAPLDRVALANTGSEAVEMAMKMAVLATGRDEFISLRGSYHGKTAGALHLSQTMAARAPLRLAAPSHVADPDDPLDREQVRARLATRRVAAVFAEPVRGEGGIRPVAEEYLAFLREETSRTGTLLVLDEIQTGLGRCGRLWRSAGAVPPDLLLTGKVLGGGVLPVAAVVYSGAKIGSSSADPVVLASSFAGGGLAGAVGLAVLDVVTDPAFLAEVARLGERTRRGLTELLGADPRVSAIRGEGLMIGLQAASESVAGHLVLEAAKRGVLLSFCLSDPTVLRAYPPAVISDGDLDDGLQRISDAVGATPMDLQKGNSCLP